MKEYICKEVPTENGGYITIETELIRCKDCKYRITANCERFGIKRYTQSDSFCSWAEPKKEKR